MQESPTFAQAALICLVALGATLALAGFVNALLDGTREIDSDVREAIEDCA